MRPERAHAARVHVRQLCREREAHAILQPGADLLGLGDGHGAVDQVGALRDVAAHALVRQLRRGLLRRGACTDESVQQHA